MTSKLRPLTERDRQTLIDLAYAGDDARKHDTRTARREGYVQVMDVGGMDGSHHSQTLVKLVKRGLAEVYEPRVKQPWRSRYSGGKLYRITEAGRTLLK